MRVFNVKPSKSASRVFIYRQQNIPIPDQADLREFDSPIDDQLSLGSCVPSAVTSAYEILSKKHFSTHIPLSRLFLYYNSRLLEETLDYDSGIAFIKNSLKAFRLCGICEESLWHYDVANFAKLPLDECYVSALSRRIASYSLVENFSSLLESLALGYPIVVGMDIFKNFSLIDQNNSTLSLPSINDTSLGGHGMCLVGYSIPEKTLLAKNSFGTTWGDKGYCKIPFDYAKKYIFEAWRFELPQTHK